MKHPKLENILEWKLQSLNSIKNDSIQQSFKYCGKSFNLDNSENLLLNPKIKDTKFVQQQIDLEINNYDSQKGDELIEIMKNDYYSSSEESQESSFIEYLQIQDDQENNTSLQYEGRQQ
ncbi:hypothetical protein TTHERM_000538619 (macronuclear) [Tetrahymena thermophila SB210]|uniref:Uncharacterized protein n=1 Tax=Tetrahymena thermophila (strain SB210) TaxID=312017 RepID=W7XLJ8_TETTS|nr:hypothetical protein TTHERM_000538619 [Tetrahymena thermophila SB210]EWS76414.1 hypothetical protein TTHERM_000538619 [Tetrahymena thermophila SB210]|eukprot:XP_012651038.1 hypothetical protein TTHERM_000538619 [Tetrahymena thermophila SB210]